MAKDDLIELQGVVVEVLAGGNYKIKVSENHEVLARLNGKMRQYRIRVIQGDRVYHANSAGQVRRDKPSWTVGKDGRVIPNDAYGNPQYHKPQCAIKDGKVYATDATGRMKRPEYEIKK